MLNGFDIVLSIPFGIYRVSSLIVSILLFITFNPFWDLSRHIDYAFKRDALCLSIPFGIYPMRMCLSPSTWNILSIPFGIYHIIYYVLSRCHNISFNPFWDLSNPTRFVQGGGEEPFNPFWDLSWHRPGPSFTDKSFQSLLGFINFRSMKSMIHSIIIFQSLLGFIIIS